MAFSGRRLRKKNRLCRPLEFPNTNWRPDWIQCEMTITTVETAKVDFLSRRVVIGPTAAFASSPATRFASFLFYRPPPNLVLIPYLQPPQGSAEDTNAARRKHTNRWRGVFKKLKRIIVVGETSAVPEFWPSLSVLKWGVFIPLDRFSCGRGLLDALFVRLWQTSIIIF